MFHQEYGPHGSFQKKDAPSGSIITIWGNVTNLHSYRNYKGRVQMPSALDADETQILKNFAIALRDSLLPILPAGVTVQTQGSVVGLADSEGWWTELDLTCSVEEITPASLVDLTEHFLHRAQNFVIEKLMHGWPNVARGETGRGLPQPYADLDGNLLALGYANDDTRFPLSSIDLRDIGHDT